MEHGAHNDVASAAITQAEGEAEDEGGNGLLEVAMNEAEAEGTDNGGPQQGETARRGVVPAA